MKTHLTYIAIIIGVILFLINIIENQKDKINQKDSIIAEQNATIEYRINENGRIVAEKIAAEASAREIAKAYPALAEELKQDFDVKMKNLKAYVRNEFEARGSGMSNITNNYYDTTLQKTVSILKFNDGYLKFSASIDSTSKAISEYLYSDTITTVIHSEKKWILGNEKLYASSKLNNPAAKVTQTSNILVKHRDKRFVISAGVYGDPLLKRWGVGISAGYALIKF